MNFVVEKFSIKSPYSSSSSSVTMVSTTSLYDVASLSSKAILFSLLYVSCVPLLLAGAISVMLSVAKEFVVPLLFGNGQTVGKKIFGIAVMRVNGVKINGVALFIRSILGKYTIETMVPVMLVIMVMLEVLGIVGPAVILLIGVLQIGLMLATRTNSAIHDCLANTVAVDLHSQMIFGSEAEVIEYKKRIHEDIANRSNY